MFCFAAIAPRGAARGIASIRAGKAAEPPAGTNSSSSGSSGAGSSGSSDNSSPGSNRGGSRHSTYVGDGPLLLRGTLEVPAAAVRLDTATTTASSDGPATASDQSAPPAASAGAGAVSAGGDAGASGAAPASTFLHMGSGWGRGEVWVNGHSLGRYWSGQGPQMTLFVPGSFLQTGKNDVIVLELEGRVPADQQAAAVQRVQGGWGGGGSTGDSQHNTLLLHKQQLLLQQKRKQQEQGEGGSDGLPVVLSVATPDFSGPPGGAEPLWV